MLLLQDAQRLSRYTGDHESAFGWVTRPTASTSVEHKLKGESRAQDRYICTRHDHFHMNCNHLDNSISLQAY